MPIENNIKKILGARPLGPTEESSGRQPTTRLDNTGTKGHKKIGFTKNKLIKSGEMFEVYVYEKAVRYGSTGKKRVSTQRKKSSRSEEHRARNIVRAGFTLKRLAFLNFSENDKFITLTFNNEQIFDINNLRECLPFYQKFLRRLRIKYKKLKFITVPEFQKRGAVHYHVLCNIPNVYQEEMHKLWPYGFSKVLAVESTTHLAFYLSKYLRKRFDDPRKQGHRLFYTSRGLERPKILYGPYAEAITNKLKRDHSNDVQYETNYETEHNGTVEYKQFVKEK